MQVFTVVVVNNNIFKNAKRYIHNDVMFLYTMTGITTTYLFFGYLKSGFGINSSHTKVNEIR